MSENRLDLVEKFREKLKPFDTLENESESIGKKKKNNFDMLESSDGLFGGIATYH